ncbi:MAG: PTS IIA-like nitrogen-regulatory protein PtsN [Gammaproteobacteria bacterium]|nr:MAG: PTS IIA-like nitrogen-regulatory protein PtsN [Gammaproteobacteria bacterium]
MSLRDRIQPQTVAWREAVTSKKRALERLSHYLSQAESGLDENAIFEKLLERERLGSTGLGQGVAIPHCRLPGVTDAVAALMTLEDGVDFEAADRRPVDLLLALVVPEDCAEVHLELLAQAAEMFSDPAFCQRLRQAPSAEALYALISGWQPRQQRRA